MQKIIKILSLLTSSLISIVSATSMEVFKENTTQKYNTGVQHGEDCTDHLAKIDTKQLPEARTEIMIKREMAGETCLEQDIFRTLKDLRNESERIDTTYLANEIQSLSKT